MKAWVKLEADFWMNQKILPLSDNAFRLYISSIGYAGAQLTDGYIPEIALAMFRAKPESVAELMAAGLWKPGEGGWWIHDYLKHQTSRAAVENRREHDRRRKESRQIPDGFQTDSDWIPDGFHLDSERIPDGFQEETGGIEIRKKKEEDRNKNLEPSESVYTDSSVSILSDFNEFWTAYPRKEGKKPALARFRQAVKVARPEVIIAGAVRYRDDPNREDGFTKLAATWLNQECWNDPPLPRRNNNGMVDQARRAPVMTLDEILGTMATKELEQ